MVLKLYGSALSTCTRRVAVVLHEKQVPFEFHNVDLSKGEHKTPEYLKKQPFGQVPYIDDDGFILYESRAIAHYIATKYANQGTPLIPTELQANAIFQQAASVELTAFNDYAEKAVAEMVFKPMRGVAGDKDVFETLIAGLSAKLDVYDQILSKQKYVAGDAITLADLYHLSYGSMLPKAGSNIIETKPNVHRWFQEISSRPSWQAVKDGVKSTA
ncbi:glutathione S-transferase [Flammula alnicola]|nr:glutathione S-transferase [Flammula alnicola]